MKKDNMNILSKIREEESEETEKVHLKEEEEVEEEKEDLKDKPLNNKPKSNPLNNKLECFYPHII